MAEKVPVHRKDDGTQLKRLRRVCLSMPGAIEKTSHGEPTFFTPRRVFAMFANNHHDDGHVAVWLPAGPDVQQAMIEEAPEMYFRPPYVGSAGWIGVELSKVDDDQLGSLIREAFQIIVAKDRPLNARKSAPRRPSRRASSRTDPRVDAYINQATDLARPILKEIRARVHEACPACEETMKWSSPSFQYKGMLCGMGAFKAHCMFGFWKAELVVGGSNPHARFRHLTSIADLPSKKDMAALIHKAMALNDDGVAVARAPREKKAPARVPADLAGALQKNKKAKTAFDGFSPSHKREYVEWITQAKRDVTRQQRIQAAVKWISEGKSRNWKYE